MRLWRLHLENYVNIYNGMGLRTLDIDFSKCRNKLLIIKGDNGSGKSSLYNCLSPFIDDSSVFMLDKDVKKVISYLLNDNSMLTITYTAHKGSNGRNKPSRCSIIRSYPDGTSFELNKNMNILTGKQIIYDLFNLDDNYITLSNVSATNKGLGTLTPHERKKYVGNILSAIGEYSELNKLFTNKLTVVKSLMKSITTKIEQIGSLEIIKQKIEEYTNSIRNLENERDALKTKEVTLLNKIEEYTKDGDPIKIYNDLTTKKQIIESKLTNMPIEDIKKCSDDKFIELSNQITKYDTTITILEDQIKELLEKENRLVRENEEYKVKIESLFNKELLDSIEDRLNVLNNNLQFYIGCFNSIGFDKYEFITQKAYIYAIDTIEYFNAHVDKLSDEYDIEILNESVKWLNTKYECTDILSFKDKMQSKLMEINIAITKYDTHLKKAMAYDMIPDKCNLSSECVFVKDIVQSKKYIEEVDISKLTKEKQSIQDMIDGATKEYTKQTKIKSCIEEIKNLIVRIESASNIMSKFSDMEFTKDQIVHYIVNNIKININTTEYREYSNYINSIQATKEDINNLTKQKEEIMSSNKEVSILKTKLESNNQEMVKLLESKQSIIGKIKDIKNKKSLILEEYEYSKTLKQYKEQYIEFSDELKEINTKLDSMNINEYKEFYNQVKELSDKLNQINHVDLPIVRSGLEECKYQTILFDQYKKDYEEYNNNYKYLVDLKRYSGINGIQTIYMSVFMNSILSEANALLSNLFKGRFKLEPFIINENEFIIPCVDDIGNRRPDISFMSDSQLSEISMILSFVLLHKSSKLYNIIKLDEVDDNLDNENRLQFVILLNHIMDMLKFDQCIIISHNDELDLNNSDLIITKVEDSAYRDYLLNSGANIIADFT